jgi:hypothetical protein
MPSLADLAHVDRAEELFELLGVPFDPRVLARGRVHVLRLCGAALAHAERTRPLASEAERLAALADALRRAHDLVARGGAAAAMGTCGGCGVDGDACGPGRIAR